MSGWITLLVFGLVLGGREFMAFNPDQFVFCVSGLAILIAVLGIVDQLEGRNDAA